MHAQQGDSVTVPGRHVGAAERHGEVLEVRGPNGSPPYLILWDDGHEAIVCPGPEMRISAPSR